ncbi:hypothetical protein J7481_11400 [Labrenzia sp. R4_2]|uniref:tetratricopeptide repeat protein n=1 Tax=Labrenzia sp. R4_2 TaxID=2821107 RepID=UPI001ADA52EE|nr:hypothetical protein [Labrenzia sp. R4_2]MBO9420103.1 hypothetical protein [Labrenzia sp. R4_2]
MIYKVKSKLVSCESFLFHNSLLHHILSALLISLVSTLAVVQSAASAEDKPAVWSGRNVDATRVFSALVAPGDGFLGGKFGGSCQYGERHTPHISVLTVSPAKRVKLKSPISMIIDNGKSIEFETFHNQAFIDTQAEAHAFETLMKKMTQGQEMIVRGSNGKKLRFQLKGAKQAIGDCINPIFANRLELSRPADGQATIGFDDYERVYGFFGPFKFTTLLGHGFWCAPHVALRADFKPEDFNEQASVDQPWEVQEFLTGIRAKCPVMRSVQVSFNPGKITGRLPPKLQRLYTSEDNFKGRKNSHRDLEKSTLVEEVTPCDVYGSVKGDFDKPLGLSAMKTPDISNAAIVACRNMIELEPQVRRHYAHLGRILLYRGDFDRAFHVLEEGARLGSATAMRYLAVLHAQGWLSQSNLTIGNLYWHKAGYFGNQDLKPDLGAISQTTGAELSDSWDKNEFYFR